MDLALNNLWLICHKTKPTQTPKQLFYNTPVSQKFCNILVVRIQGFFYNTRVSQSFAIF